MQDERKPEVQNAQLPEQEPARGIDKDVDELYDEGTLAYKLRHCSDAAWSKIQIIGGVLTGFAAAFVMFIVPETDTLGPMRWAIGIAIALLVPRLAENAMQRDIRKGRLALLVTFGLGFITYGILVYFGYAA
jgi:hypothetical protein